VQAASCGAAAGSVWMPIQRLLVGVEVLDTQAAVRFTATVILLIRTFAMRIAALCISPAASSPKLGLLLPIICAVYTKILPSVVSGAEAPPRRQSGARAGCPTARTAEAARAAVLRAPGRRRRRARLFYERRRGGGDAPLLHERRRGGDDARATAAQPLLAIPIACPLSDVSSCDGTRPAGVQACKNARHTPSPLFPLPSPLFPFLCPQSPVPLSSCRLLLYNRRDALRRAAGACFPFPAVRTAHTRSIRWSNRHRL
jgi:hypothetical protein